jgi:hypothetical protein
MVPKSTHGGARPGAGRKRIKREFRHEQKVLFHSVFPDGTWSEGRLATVEIDRETGDFAFVYEDGERQVADW